MLAAIKRHSAQPWPKLTQRWLSSPAQRPSQAALDPSGPPTTAAEPQWAAATVHGRSLYLPYQHPKTHNIPVAMIHFRSYFPHLLDQFTHFASHSASALAIPISRPVALPTQRSLWTVLKGPFAHKKKQENFERKVHKRAIKAWDADPEVIERWVKYLENHAMGGVGMRVIKWERTRVGVGKDRLEHVRGQTRLASATSSDKVKALSEKIVQQELTSNSVDA
ncbi:ribosomal protein S10 [Thelephora ganbajun]|uniref:Ribosomal protein S10 n=1 Tax=Thelephora ganbajun TaxID=370292 RepID=A0ACB6ZLB1_THEGA|nr:ribosomal protein S10 [Thelephora ganbajun]